LSREGFSIEILDSLEPDSKGEIKKTALDFPHEFEYLKRYYHPNKSPFKLFTNFYHFGLGFEEIYKKIELIHPDIVGISSNFTAYFKEVRVVASLVKRFNKDIPIIVGGHHPTAMPLFTMNDKNIDFIIRGEGEYSFLKLLEKIRQGNLKDLKKIDGVCFRKNGKVVLSDRIAIIKELDTLPFPGREFLNWKNYKFKG